MQTVVMTVSDRPHYLAETLASWDAVRGSRDWQWLFMVEPSNEVATNIALIDAWSRRNRIDDVTLHMNHERLGVLRNPWHGIDKAISTEEDTVVLAEEDVPVSSDVLEYMSWGFDTLATADDVLGLCAWSGTTGAQPDECVLRSDFNPLLWGTWGFRWKNDLRDTWDHDYSTGVNGQGAGWDWNIKCRIMKDRKFLFPLASRSTHIGVTGVHMQPHMFHESQAPSFELDRPATTYRIVN